MNIKRVENTAVTIKMYPANNNKCFKHCQYDLKILSFIIVNLNF